MEAGSAGAPHPRVGHLVPLRLLVATWSALLALTFLTVAASWVDFGGNWNLWIALAIAVGKASLVVLFFMHMRWERPFNAVVFISALAFFMLFVGIALLDSRAYDPLLIPGDAPALVRP